MKRILAFVFVFLAVAFCGGIDLFAEGDLPVAEEVLESAGENMPLNAKEFLEENGIKASEPEGILKVTPKDVLSYIWDSFKSELKAPLKTAGILLGIVMLASLFESIGDFVVKDELSKVYEVFIVLLIVTAAAKPIASCMERISAAISDGGNFMLCYVPVFSGILAASGGASAAVSYQMIVLFAAELFVQLSGKLFIPAVSVALGLTALDGISPAVSLSGLNRGIKKAVTWGVGMMMTVFVGLLTVQSLVGTSVDTVAVKAAKFAVSSMVPLVGGALSEAYSTLRGSMGILRSGIGTFGIISLLVTMLPPLLSAGAMQLSVLIAATGAEILGVKSAEEYLKNLSSILGTAVSLLLCFGLMLIVSTAIVMMVGMNFQMG